MLNYRLGKSALVKSLAIVLLMFFAVSVLPLSPAEAAIWNPGGSTHPYLTPKWTASVSGGGEALLSADVRSDYAGEEVFHAGGPAQPSSTSGSVTCVSGQTGNQIWRTYIPGVGDTATMQMSDIDRDGKLEIIVALQAPAGMYILNAEDGSRLWRATGTYNGNAGYFTPVGGRIDGSGVIGDTDGDGYPDIFIGVMAYEEQPTTGKIIHYEWSGSTIVERGRVQVWHPCAGGLSLGDTDNDGIFELYMNERDVYFGDGSWGRGTTSFIADSLTKRWSIYDWGASSDIPMLADVNKDGIVDIVSTNLGSGIFVLNSTDGHPLKNAAGTVLYSTRLQIRAHYQSSVYDIDRDGNLELLCADGSQSGSYGTQVWDLWSWKLDKNITAGYSFRGPSLGDVTGDGQMDIIVVTFDYLGNTDTGSVKIYNQNYQQLDSYGGLKHRAIGSFVQDVDRNDGGLNELLVLTQGGIIYCFDTPGLSQEHQGLPRARSEVHFFSESRLGASEYVPYHRPWPDVVSPNPSPNAIGVSTSLGALSFRLSHPLSQAMTYTVTTSPNIGSGSGSGSGAHSVTVGGLKASTTYRWQVAVTDSSGRKTSKNYWFTTAPVISNSPPTHGTPILNSSYGYNTDIEDLIAYNQTTTDPNGDEVTNIYNWLKGSGSGNSITNLVLPFDTKPDSEAVYSGTAVTRDYSGRGNNGNIFGATWTQGRVGGALSFDGNDFVRIEEQSNSLDGGGAWSAMSIEFWIKATQTGSNWKLIWKPDRYETSIKSYEVDFQYLSTGSLKFTWAVNTTASRSFNTNATYQTSAAVTAWHHVVCTYRSGTGLKIYFDGVQVTSRALTGNIVDTEGPLEIAFNRGRDFVGVIDEVRLYPSEVSAAFVNRRYLDTKGGLSSKSTIPAEYTVVGDVWRCQVTPNDGLADGTTKTSATLTVLAARSLPPHIDYYYPEDSVLTIDPGQSIAFKQVSSDPNGNSLTYRWTMDTTTTRSTAQNWTASAAILTAGTHTVTITVSDGTYSDSHQWTVDVSAPLEQYMLNIHITGQGSVTKNPSQTAYASGSVVGLAAVPATGWSFSGWSGDLTGNTNHASITMDGDKTVAATFTQDEYTLIVTTVGSGTVDKMPPQTTYHYGDDVTLTATATDTGWRFVGWSDDATGTTNPLQITITGDTSVTATFSNKYVLTVEVVGRGKVTLNPSGGLYTDSTVVDLTPVADAGYTFTGWSGDLTGDNSPETMTMDGDKTVTATFTANQYTLSVHVVGTGCSVTKVPNQATYTYGTQVDLTAVKANGWTFSAWSGDSSGAGSTTSVTMNGNKIVTATFTQDEYTLNVIIAGSGSVGKNPSQATYHYGDSVILTASPAEGWLFSSWSGDLSGSVNPRTIVMNNDRTVTATFIVPGTHLFADDFESGSFGAWSGTSITGGSTNVVSAFPHTGMYSGRFNVNTGTSDARRAYCYENVNGLTELYATAYVYVTSGLPLANGKNMWFIQFEGPVGTVLASFGVKANSSGTRWAVQSGSSSSFIGTSGPSRGVWYLLQAYFTHAASGKTLVLTVNGVEVASLNQNTASATNVARVRFGLPFYGGTSTASVYLDDATIDSEVTPPTLYSVSLQSRQIDSSTTNLGTITCDGTKYALPNSASEATGTYTVSFSASLGYVFDHWVTSGSVSVANSNAQSTTLTISGTGSLAAIYSPTAPPTHLFADDFESGLFNAWTGTTTTTGATANVALTMPHSGTYSGQFLVNAGPSSPARRAYAYENVGGLAELTANAYVYIADGLPLANGQSMWLIQFVDSGGNALASFGVRADSSGLHWAVQYSSYPYAVAASSVAAPLEGQWYRLQAYYTHASTGKTIVLTVNGAEVASLTQNTSSANNVANVRFGVDYYVNTSAAQVYIDDVTIDNALP